MASRTAGRGPGDHVAGEPGVEDLAVDPVLGEQPVGREVAVRRIVLVQGVDATRPGRAGRLGQRLAELGLPSLPIPIQSTAQRTIGSPSPIRTTPRQLSGWTTSFVGS